ncbi:MAG TPA: MoxR family ATPase [candidate division Zixibacteria bacterium]|nr:MoxR family ATPase [candidate division Zixibacteria bacterium]
MAENKNDVNAVNELAAATKKIKAEIAKVIVGQEKVIHEMMIALLSGGHVLLIGVPGLAKTLMISTLAQALDLKFNRIQFTPDLMPSDITGTEILEEDKTTGNRIFRFVSGPVFCNILLADEINRTPPKTQAALLQAMQEHEVSAGDRTFKLDMPFFVLSTQNPIEQEGTYPLPEAQLDRFMLNIFIDYPSEQEELEIVRYTTGARMPVVETVLDSAKIIELQNLVRRIPAADYIIQYAIDIVRNTRPETTKLDYVKRWVRWGAGPRAGQFLTLGAKTSAALDGRVTPGIDDIKGILLPVLRHRIITSFTADAEGITTDEIIKRLLDDIEPPKK